jgi:hypothetical protein
MKKLFLFLLTIPLIITGVAGALDYYPKYKQDRFLQEARSVALEVVKVEQRVVYPKGRQRKFQIKDRDYRDNRVGKTVYDTTFRAPVDTAEKMEDILIYGVERPLELGTKIEGFLNPQQKPYFIAHGINYYNPTPNAWPIWKAAPVAGVVILLFGWLFFLIIKGAARLVFGKARYEELISQNSENGKSNGA